MGYRCPSCKADFGNDKKRLQEHFENYNNSECSVISSITLRNIDIMTGKRKNKFAKPTTQPAPRKKYSYIDTAHNFQKINAVSNEDGSDVVVCKNCGLTGKRFLSTYKFDGRISYKRIETCL